MVNYEPDVSRLLALYQQLEDDVIADMVRRILKMGFVSETTAYQADVLQTAGLLYEDILQLIANRTDASVAQVRALFEDAGVQTVELDNETHEAAGEAPVDIRQDPGMKQVLEAGYRKTLGTMRNLVSTTANATQTAFIQTCDRAYMQMSSGAFSYQEAIRMAVRNLADTGAYITYPTGHKDRIDVAVRRCILTGVGQTAAAVAKQHAESAGCYLMELTAHGGARPEHARWQGQLVSLNGKDVGKTIDGLRVFSLSDIGYGDGAGFKGWNCRHNWHPYYPGLSTPNYTPEQIKQLDAKTIAYNGEKYTEYEVSQMQRAGERKVRALKRRTLAAQEAVKAASDDETRAVLESEYAATAAKLKGFERELNDFCKQTKRRKDTFRMQVNGFGRSEAQKAVHGAKRMKSSLTLSKKSDKMKDSGNVFHAVTDDSYRKLQNMNVFKDSRDEKMIIAMKHVLDNIKKENVGTESLAIYDYKTLTLINESIADNADGAVKRLASEQPYISIHNHPSGETFSSADIQVLCDDKKCMIIAVVGNNGNSYILEKTEKFDSTGLFEYVMKKKYGFTKYNSEEEFVSGCEKYGIKYYKRAD